MKWLYTTISLVFLGFSLFAQSVSSRVDELDFGAERPKIGVVLSGGGAKGIAHVGTLKMLEKLNIPIDYIGGTSMGAIVGSLFAMGYTADQIDTIIRVTDWGSLFNDFPKRELTGIREKNNNDPYQLRLAFAPGEFSIFAKGAIEGQHIDNMLTHYLFEGYKIQRFSDLQIPFFAIGADLISGGYAVIDSGNLAQAVRASMAVPTVFSPVVMNNRMLVDGGVINNFPILEMREKGMDIIIGVDVGYHYKDKDELKNLGNILEQVIFLGSHDLQDRNMRDCDILIKPDMTDMAAFNFGKNEAILERGYEAAELALPELEKLAYILNEKYGSSLIDKPLHHLPKTVVLDTIVLNGNNDFSAGLILSRLQLPIHKELKISDIEDAVQRLFGTLLFTKVTYHFDKSPIDESQVILHINLQEAPLNTAKLGFRYDNIRGPSLLAGLTMRIPKILNSEFNANLDLSTWPIVDLQYRISPFSGLSKRKSHSIWAPSLYISYTLSNMEVYEYVTDKDGKTTRSKEEAVTGQRAAIGAEINVKSNTIGYSLNVEQTISSEHVGGTGQILNASYWYSMFYYVRNSFNHRYYPTKGTTMNAQFRWLNTFENFNKRRTPEINWVKTFATYSIENQHALAITKRLTLYPSFMLAGTIVFDEKDRTDNYISEQQQFYQGGLFSIPHTTHTPFVGLYFMQKVGLYNANAQINAQYKVFRDIYVSARFGLLESENDPLQMLDFNDMIVGWGISASVNTTAGPVGITLQRSNRTPMNFVVNVGFWF